MRNDRGDLLYVGKATRLKDRVGSYFNGGNGIKAKTAELVSHVWAIETLLMRSSLEAALTEARMIRDLKPPYNRMLKWVAPAYFMRIDLMTPSRACNRPSFRAAALSRLDRSWDAVDWTARFARSADCSGCARAAATRTGRGFFALRVWADGALLGSV